MFMSHTFFIRRKIKGLIPWRTGNIRACLGNGGFKWMEEY
jgi:hypothetical protein